MSPDFEARVLGPWPFVLCVSAEYVVYCFYVLNVSLPVVYLFEFIVFNLWDLFPLDYSYNVTNVGYHFSLSLLNKKQQQQS